MNKCQRCRTPIDAPSGLCVDCCRVYYSPPCKACTERNLGCHSSCTHYAEWLEVRAAAKELQRIEHDSGAVYFNGLNRLQARQRRRNT